MVSRATIPATLPVHFGECMIQACGEFDYYRTQLGAVVIVDGRLDEQRLRHALRLLLDAEPGLGCRFALDAKPPVWRWLDDLDARDLLLVRTSDDLAGEASAFVADPLDQQTDPQVLAALVRGPSSDALGVKVSHVAMDGGALKEMLYLIASIYRRLAKQPDWTPVPNVDGVRGAFARAGLLERIRAIPEASSATSPPKSDWAVPVLGDRGPATYAWATVEPDVFRQAVALAKPSGVTVNDFVLTAYYRTCYRLLGAAPGSHTPISIPCELRKHLPEGTKTALSNIATAWWASVSPAEGEGFDDTLSRVAKVTQDWKQSGAGKPAAIWMPTGNRLFGKHALRFFRKMLAKGAEVTAGKGGPPTLTNIGIIDDARLDFGTEVRVADAWLLGPISVMTLILTATTCRDRLHLAIGTEFAAVSEGLVHAVLEGVVEEIHSWVAGRVTASRPTPAST